MRIVNNFRMYPAFTRTQCDCKLNECCESLCELMINQFIFHWYRTDSRFDTQKRIDFHFTAARKCDDLRENAIKNVNNFDPTTRITTIKSLSEIA